MLFTCKKNFYLMVCLTAASLQAHDLLLEFKGAYFLSTDHLFKKIYHNGGGIYGGELTGKFRNNWYGFISADFLRKQGKSLGFPSPTEVDMAAVGIGLKYFIPISCVDFYIGLGILPLHLTTLDSSPYVPYKHSKWGCGGIAKLGAYIDLPHSCFLDVFFNYSFANVTFTSKPDSPTVLHNAHVDGCWFGAGIGYRFN